MITALPAAAGVKRMVRLAHVPPNTMDPSGTTAWLSDEALSSSGPWHSSSSTSLIVMSYGPACTPTGNPVTSAGGVNVGG